jgi:polar amino acid transport system substrate-binding protein
MVIAEAPGLLLREFTWNDVGALIMKPGIFNCFVLTLMLSSHCYAQDEIVLAAGGIENDPFDKISQEVLKKAYKRIDMDVSFLTLPPPRALRMSNSGLIDGEMHRVVDVDREFENLIMIPVSINTVNVVAFVKTKDITINNLEDLGSYKIGVVRGVKFADDLTQGMHVEKSVTIDQLFLMLDKGRFDAAVSNEIGGLEAIKKLNIKGVIELSPNLKEHKLYHYLNSKHQSIIPRITSALQEMEKNGIIQKIYEEAVAELSE